MAGTATACAAAAVAVDAAAVAGETVAAGSAVAAGSGGAAAEAKSGWETVCRASQPRQPRQGRRDVGIRRSICRCLLLWQCYHYSAPIRPPIPAARRPARPTSPTYSNDSGVYPNCPGCRRGMTGASHPKKTAIARARAPPHAAMAPTLHLRHRRILRGPCPVLKLTERSVHVHTSG